MKARLAALLAVLLAFPGLPARAQSPTLEAYNAKATPLDDLSRDLLLETGYVIREDGKVWDKIADNAVRLDEMSYLLNRLAGARRLKALLELNLILNKSEGEKHLTADEREAVRAILRKNWAVFGVGTRKDFRSYFSVQELTEELDKIPARFDKGSALLMRDPDPATALSSALTAAPISVTAPPPAAIEAPVPVLPPEPESLPVSQAPRQFIPRSVLTPFLEPLSLRRPSPFAPRVKQTPVAPAPQAVAVTPAPVPAPAAVAPTVAAPVAVLMGGLTPLPPPAPMIFAAETPPPAPSAPPAPTAVAAVPYVAPARAPVALPDLAPLTPPRPVPVTDAAPVTGISSPGVVTSHGLIINPTPGQVVGAAPTNSLFGTAPPAAPVPSVAPAALGKIKSWEAPTASAAAAAAAAAAVAAAPAPPVVAPPAIVRASAPPPPADASPAEYDAYVANGPYSREGQALLKMLAAKAPEFCRAILRRTVVRGTPLIVFDGARAGSDRRAGFAPYDPAKPGVTIALSEGPVLVEHKTGLFSRSEIALPEDSRAWAEIGISVPAVDALKKGVAPVSQENGPWGVAHVYSDGSRRGTYSPQEQAGELLERLLLLGLEREGFASSTYAARAWARAARLLFSARVAEDYGNDSFLDPDRKQELRDWIERGDESDDLMIASWSSSRGNVLDPRRGGPESQAAYERRARESCTRSLLADHLAEAARDMAARVRTVEALNDSGLLSNDAARAAAEKATNDEALARKSLLALPPVCDGRFGADENGLHRSTALIAEVSRAERAFRERKSRGTQE